jgi:hypothetical protein
MLTTVNINNHVYLSHLRQLKQNLPYRFLLLSTSPVIPLKEAECVSEGGQVRTTWFSSAIPWRILIAHLHHRRFRSHQLQKRK